jgi:hypothetical protein
MTTCLAMMLGVVTPIVAFAADDVRAGRCEGERRDRRDGREGRKVETGRRSVGPDRWSRTLGLSAVEPPKAPGVARSDWPRASLDPFLLARLEDAKLSPAPDADRRTLARRLHLQLVGLPPTPEQMAEFLADERVDAVERLVDQLLSSPHFGERWGRHWLDLAQSRRLERARRKLSVPRGLAVSQSGDREASMRTCLTIDCWSNRSPAICCHDSIEQRNRQRLSAGFLLVGPKVLLGNNDDERRMDIADEQLDAIGRTVLGQTIGCARCHDHKFDPIPTADYYSLAGIFTSTEVMERRYMLGEQRLMERLVGVGEVDGASNT